ncbi:Septation ring formation regulator EzrA [Caldalkalibacillus thermarum TA2.A1]|uniref:Septation ring formation regulator EzrA n=1 Tax=Caldalkalibacillus thermarum (strain TA2.A1) TaxID=986075 RepID=F5L3G4_CALTT|nr:septation ring formation regulator EzrA [Caldalkalibacillus thermarum]EGL84125.1 Septation ring formation regulator EzrA [Caldalkalibacillus thermarum TA2.A1]QZT35069.1 septation ring formation regulator EzrA [Caldalkalibacillus thermarum TA2.A1]
MWLIITLLLIICVFLLYLAGLLYRRRIYQQVDKLEQWKNDIENRPVADELARLKNLKLAGETEASFEKWKSQWEEIVTDILPDLEEMLIDIEDYALRFRLVTCRQLLQEAQEKLWSVEETLETIKEEIDQLTDSEKSNREKMTVLHEQLQELKRLLHKHAMGLGISYPVWYDKYKQAVDWYHQFQEEHNNGNYFQARELLNKVDQACQELYEAIEVCPNIIRTIEHDIPRKLQEVEEAIQEMERKGYQVSHTGAEEQLAEMLKSKHQVVAYMQNGDIERMKHWQDHVLEGIEEIYQRLEQEVENKAYVIEKLGQLDDKHAALLDKFNELKRTVSEFKLAYSWDSEWESKHETLQKMFKAVQHTYDALKVDPEKMHQLYPALKPELERYFKHYDQLLEKTAAFEEEIQTIRKDELEAKAEAQELKRNLTKVRVNLRKSNLPGLPDHVQSGLNIAAEALQELQASLEQTPIDMHRVQHQLKEAKTQVQSISQVASIVIELAQKAEQLIQFGNRFRREHAEVREILEDAEQAFRDLQFQEAVELAEEALDIADRNWRKKLEGKQSVSV